MALEYNEQRGAVDDIDHTVTLEDLTTRQHSVKIKWYHAQAVWWSLLDTMLGNSNKVWCMHNKEHKMASGCLQ